MRRALTCVGLLLASGAATADPLWDNGPLVTHAAGMANGIDDRSAISPGGTLFGFGAQQTAGNRMADDFVSEADWTLESLRLYAYQTAVGVSAPTITGVTLRIWGAAGPGVGNPVWGDNTTNVLTSASVSNAYRTTSTANNNTDRRIQVVDINLPNLQLGAGTFWIDYSFTGTLASGPWNPPVSSPTAHIEGNAVQATGGTDLFNPGLDAGLGLQCALPFVLFGSSGPASCLGDIADDFGFTVDEGGGPDGVVDFGDFVALLGLIGPCP